MFRAFFASIEEIVAVIFQNPCKFVGGKIGNSWQRIFVTVCQTLQQIIHLNFERIRKSEQRRVKIHLLYPAPKQVFHPRNNYLNNRFLCIKILGLFNFTEFFVGFDEGFPKDETGIGRGVGNIFLDDPSRCEVFVHGVGNLYRVIFAGY